MRAPIWKKNDFFNLGGEIVNMDADAVTIRERGVPLVNNFDLKAPMGKVEDIRTEDGEITGEVVLFDADGASVEDWFETFRLGGMYREVEKTEDNKTVTSCTLTCVSFVTLGRDGMPESSSPEQETPRA